MALLNNETNNASAQSKLLDGLRNPDRFRMAVLGVVLAVGYCLVYMPLSGRIQGTTQRLENARTHLALVRDIESLQGQFRRVQSRLPKNTDVKEWATYVLNGMRPFSLKLLKLNCDDPRSVGPCTAVVLRLDVEGDFFEADRFLRWLESDKRLFRVDSVRFTPTRGSSTGLSMQFTILGLTG